jgi:hypothetical protein
MNQKQSHHPLVEIVGIVIVGTCICFAWVADLLTGRHYLTEIREIEGRIRP